MQPSFILKSFVTENFVSRLMLFYSLFIISVVNVSAQSFEKIQSTNELSGFRLRNKMIKPFSSQMPVNIYQSHYMHRSTISIQFEHRNFVSKPVVCGRNIIIGDVPQQEYSRILLNTPSINTYCKQTPQKGIFNVETIVSYKSFPTINTKGEVVSDLYEGEVVPIGTSQALPGNWSEPGMPICDFAFPMLLFVGFYSLISIIRNFKK